MSGGRAAARRGADLGLLGWGQVEPGGGGWVRHGEGAEESKPDQPQVVKRRMAESLLSLLPHRTSGLAQGDLKYGD